MTQMIEVKAAELVGPALDWAVATVEGMNPSTYFYRHEGYWVVPIARGGYNPGGKSVYWFSPSTNWSQGGPLIATHRVSVIYSDETCDPCAWTDRTAPWHGSTPLIAACRAIVAAKLGEVVNVPAELA